MRLIERTDEASRTSQYIAIKKKIATIRENNKTGNILATARMYSPLFDRNKRVKLRENDRLHGKYSIYWPIYYFSCFHYICFVLSRDVEPDNTRRRSREKIG